MRCYGAELQHSRSRRQSTGRLPWLQNSEMFAFYSRKRPRGFQLGNDMNYQLAGDPVPGELDNNVRTSWNFNSG